MSLDPSLPAYGLRNLVGCGLRSEYIQNILDSSPSIGFFELLADNHFNLSNENFDKLRTIAHSYPVSIHCVGLSIASVTPFDNNYIKKLKALSNQLKCHVISDHLCWTHAEGIYTHELIPIPYNHDSLSFVIERVSTIQDLLNTPIMLENVSRYVSYTSSNIPEVEFFNQLCDATGCGVLLDINNLYVNQFNHGDDAMNFLTKLNSKHVWQMHLGGHSSHANYLLDSHDSKIEPSVWSLFSTAQKQFPKTPTIIEWDNELPEFSVLLSEVEKAQLIMRNIEAEREYEPESFSSHPTTLA